MTISRLLKFIRRPRRKVRSVIVYPPYQILQPSTPPPPTTVAPIYSPPVDALCQLLAEMIKEKLLDTSRTI